MGCVSGKSTMEDDRKGTLYLDLLPEEILLHVSQFLYFKDIINLSMTCKRMKKVMPKFKLEVKQIKGPNINITEVTGVDSWHPSQYFDTPYFESSGDWEFQWVHQLGVSMGWKDQVRTVLCFMLFIIIDDRIRPLQFPDHFKFPRDGETRKEDFMSN